MTQQIFDTYRIFSKIAPLSKEIPNFYVLRENLRGGGCEVFGILSKVEG